MTMKERLARWLCPALAQDADAHWRLRVELDDVQRWLGGEFPAVDQAIHFAKVKTRNYFRGLDEPAVDAVPGKPWIHDVSRLRDHLREQGREAA